MNSGRERAIMAINEVKKAVVGNDRAIEMVMTAIIANGHILIEDIPGVGKTTMAVAFSKALGLKYNRVSFTPDVMPSDLVGFSAYDKNTGGFSYVPGTLMCNLFLADELNRTSPKTQSALLEVMEEKVVTVDGTSRIPGSPFIVIATENPEGSAGTQQLPQSQLDRFMVSVTMGYPSEDQEIEILKLRKLGKTTDAVSKILTPEEVVMMQDEAKNIYVSDQVYRYISRLASDTRKNKAVSEALSPRASVALSSMAMAIAWLRGREYVTPKDVRDVFPYVARHRIKIDIRSKASGVRPDDVLKQTIEKVAEPKTGIKK